MYTASSLWHPWRAQSLRPRRRFNFRNPSPVWRRVFVGLAFTPPGAVAGLLVAICVAGPWWLGIFGAVAAFLAGYFWEGT
jgi:hypothetical protein